jgi:hypothetical protein
MAEMVRFTHPEGKKRTIRRLASIVPHDGSARADDLMDFDGESP